ncbi:hypothetical protein HY857_02785 [Candidatus Saccharibacteria bacterium]|nr:hypothetical protein [Candidatus Saccharibacteria bacterium]
MDDRIFDVSKPNRSAPSATSKPIIVGHHPIMNDPMVTGRDNEPAQTPAVPQPFAPAASEPEATPTMSHTFPSVPDNPEPLPPVDGGIGSPVDSLAISPEPSPTGMTGGGDQQFIRPDKTEETHHSQHNWSPPTHPSVTPAPISHHPRGSKKTMMLIVLVLVALVGAYLAVDAGLIGKNINLPFHIFKQDSQTQTPSTTKTPAPTTPTPSPSSSTLPEGFTAYKLAGTGLSIPYPTVWGEPTSTPEMGYSKRGGTNKADVTYAYLISFATNKDVQIAVTSGQYLPPTRAALYYDFLQWCTGTADAKFYKQMLHFTTTAGVDTPSTATCDQGPLADAVKINDTTIVQAGTKAADGTVAGDVYTRNLKITKLPVMRVKDATAKNSDNIKKILENLTLDTAAETQ